MSGTQSGGPAFEEIQAGDQLPPLVIGPFTPIHLMRFSAAIENWHRIHYDERFAREHERLPGLLISGSYKQHLVAQMLRRWAAPAGWLLRVSLQFRRMNVVGETLTAWGAVTGTEAHDGFGLVRCELGIRNQDGVESSPGVASVALPLAGGKPILCSPAGWESAPGSD